MTKVKEIMCTNCKHVSSNTTIHEAAKLMKDLDVGFLPVSDNDKLVGMITDRDIVIRTLANGKDVKSTTVKEIMTPKCLYCFEEDSVEEASQNLGKNQVHRMPVLNASKRLVGILSTGDFWRKGLNQQAATALNLITKASR